MGGFTVTADALLAFAKRCEHAGTEMDRLSKSLLGARVNRDAFGHIPEVGSKIYDAYDKHVDQCEQGAASAASAIHATAANVALTAGTYLQAEHGSTVK